MYRVSLLIALCLAMTMSAAAECDLRSVWRGANVSDYAPKATACLQAPRSEIWFDAAVEEEIFNLVNEERVSRGLTRLTLRPELLPPARIHSFDMAQEDFFAHEGADGRRAGDRVANLDRTLILSEIRENIARFGGDLNYADTGRLLHGALMNSEGHRKNILAENVTHVAIGLARMEKGAWVTQVFVRQEGQLDAPLAGSMSISAPPTVAAQLTDWEVRTIVLQDEAGNEFEFGDEIPNLTDDLRLLVIGQRRLDERRTATIKLIGPVTSPTPSRTPQN